MRGSPQAVGVVSARGVLKDLEGESAGGKSRELKKKRSSAIKSLASQVAPPVRTQKKLAET